jgi:hypothetical protein
MGSCHKNQENKEKEKLVWYLDTEDTMAAEKREPKEENGRRRRMMDQNH